MAIQPHQADQPDSMDSLKTSTTSNGGGGLWRTLLIWGTIVLIVLILAAVAPICHYSRLRPFNFEPPQMVQRLVGECFNFLSFFLLSRSTTIRLYWTILFGEIGKTRRHSSDNYRHSFGNYYFHAPFCYCSHNGLRYLQAQTERRAVERVAKGAFWGYSFVFVYFLFTLSSSFLFIKLTLVSGCPFSNNSPLLWCWSGHEWRSGGTSGRYY